MSRVDEEEYRKHLVFEELEKFISFYGDFSMSMSITGFATVEVGAVVNIDTYIYSSIQGTLESIKLVLENGRIGDAFALLRKYHDAVILRHLTKDRQVYGMMR